MKVVADKYFSIGETARINNVSIQALRLYDRMGLLKPAYVDQESNYRYYTMDQFIFLDLIRHTKQVGTPLKELKDVFHNKDVDTLLEHIRKQEAALESEILRLKKVSMFLESIGDKIEYATKLEKTNEIFYRDVEKRLVAYVGINEENRDTDTEIKFRNLDNILNGYDIMLGGETGYFVDLDLLLNKGTLQYDKFYTTLCGANKKSLKGKVDIHEIPRGKCLCIIYSNEERERALEKLRQYVLDNKIETKGIGYETHLFNTLEHVESDEILNEFQIFI